jgi:hypothetical protein
MSCQAIPRAKRNYAEACFTSHKAASNFVHGAITTCRKANVISSVYRFFCQSGCMSGEGSFKEGKVSLAKFSKTTVDGIPIRLVYSGLSGYRIKYDADLHFRKNKNPAFTRGFSDSQFNLT